MEQRYLRYFDFDTGSFEEAPSRLLFTEDRLNPQEVETWLNSVIETPLAARRRRIVNGDANALDDWEFYRAATLMVWLQGARRKAQDDLGSREHLLELARRSMDQIDTLVAAFREEYDLSLATIGSEAAPLFVPGNGCFPVVYRDDGCLSGHAIAFALPIAPHCALCVVPVEKHGRRHLESVPRTLSRLSIGTSKVRRVVVLPAFVDRVGEEIARKYLAEMRRENDSLVEGVSDAKRLVLKAFSVAGAAPVFDHADRIIPPGPVDALLSYV
ncbi:MAG TPA: hypothetical protein VGD37_36935 [Kofleriaceae bacterium]|jgi:hypothetical protein